HDPSESRPVTFAATVATLLGPYAPADPRERDFRTRMLELNRQPGAWERSHFEPGHFTASAFILSPDLESLLLIFHDKLRRWLQPGGHVDPGDASPLETARREVSEEVGLVNTTSAPSSPAVFDIDIHLIPARAFEPAHEHFDFRFLLLSPTYEFRATS